jgi:hypothetical protein
MTEKARDEAAAEEVQWPDVQPLLERAARRLEERSRRVVREVAECLAVGDTPSRQVQEDRRAATEAAFADVEPGDEIASLLVAQLMTVHGMAMDCVRSARDPARDERLRLAYLGHSGRLLSLFSRHVGRLDRHNDWLHARVEEIMSRLRRIEAQHERNEEFEMYNDFIIELANKDRANAAAGERPGGDGALANDSDADEFAA